SYTGARASKLSVPVDYYPSFDVLGVVRDALGSPKKFVAVATIPLVGGNSNRGAERPRRSNDACQNSHCNDFSNGSPARGRCRRAPTTAEPSGGAAGRPEQGPSTPCQTPPP